MARAQTSREREIEREGGKEYRKGGRFRSRGLLGPRYIVI